MIVQSDKFSNHSFQYIMLDTKLYLQFLTKLFQSIKSSINLEINWKHRSS